MRYATGTAFRTALETHLRARAMQTGLQIPRLRRAVSYDRLLARLLIAAPDRWVLKGALALEFRIGRGARPTKDMDLGRHDDPAAATADMKAVGLLDLDDYFTFEIIETTKLAALPAATAVRYQVRAALGGRTFEQFVVDVGFGGTLGWTPDPLPVPALLVFAGIAAVEVPTIPLELHVAEKLHAYTRGYSDGTIQSTRVKDMVDLVLIAGHAPFQARMLRAALSGVFAGRNLQPLLSSVPAPPRAWVVPYARMAREVGIDTDVRAGHARVAAFLDPVLAAESPTGRWDQVAQRWITEGEGD